MISDDTRKTIRFIIWVLVFVVLFYIGSVLVFFGAGSPSRKNDRQMASLASQQTPIINVQNYYHLDRGVNSYALKGTSRKGKEYYFIYLPHSKKAYVYPARKGESQTKIRRRFNRLGIGKISTINLGWYKGKAAWEVSYQKSNGSLGYALYDFKSGEMLNRVDNL